MTGTVADSTLPTTWCGSDGVLEWWSLGVLEWWNDGVVEYWSNSVLECWKYSDRVIDYDLNNKALRLSV